MEESYYWLIGENVDIQKLHAIRLVSLPYDSLFHVQILFLIYEMNIETLLSNQRY